MQIAIGTSRIHCNPGGLYVVRNNAVQAEIGSTYGLIFLVQPYFTRFSV